MDSFVAEQFAKLLQTVIILAAGDGCWGFEPGRLVLGHRLGELQVGVRAETVVGFD